MVINKPDEEKLTKFVETIISKVSNKLEAGLDSDVTISDFDGTRIYLDANATEFNVRLWDIQKSGKIRWTLYKMIDDKNGHGHGEELCDGTNMV